MSAADTLAAAGRLIAAYGHNPADQVGSPLTGYSLTAAVALAAADMVADLLGDHRHAPETGGYARLGAWVKVRSADLHLLAALGHCPDWYSPSQARSIIAAAGFARPGVPLATPWAAAVCEQAAALAAASNSTSRPLADAIAARTLMLPIVAAVA